MLIGSPVRILRDLDHIDVDSHLGNLCWSMPCLNGGSCFGSAYTYLCVCPINYSGALCEKRLGSIETIDKDIHWSSVHFQAFVKKNPVETEVYALKQV